MLSMPGPSENTELIKKINEFSAVFGISALSENATEEEILDTLIGRIEVERNDFSLAYLFINMGDQNKVLENLIQLHSMFTDTEQQSILRDNVIAHALKYKNNELLNELPAMLSILAQDENVTENDILEALIRKIQVEGDDFSLAYSFINTGDKNKVLENLIQLQCMLSITEKQSILRDNVISYALKHENKDVLNALGYVPEEKLLPKSKTYSSKTANSNAACSETATVNPSHNVEIPTQHTDSSSPIPPENPDEPMSSAMSAAMSLKTVPEIGAAAERKYERIDNPSSNNENNLNHKEHSLNEWHRVLFQAEPNENLLTLHKINMLKKVFPWHEFLLNESKRNVPALHQFIRLGGEFFTNSDSVYAEFKYLNKAILSLIVVWDSSINLELKNEVLSFVAMFRKFGRMHHFRVTEGACNKLNNLLDLLEKLIKSKANVDYDNIVKLPKLVTRSWFLAIRLEAKNIWGSPRGRLLGDIVEHFDWLTEHFSEEQFSEEHINYSVWLLCFRRLVKVTSSSIINKIENSMAAYEGEKSAVKLINITPAEARKLYLMPLVQELNGIIESKYPQQAILSCDSSDKEINDTLEPNGPVKITDLFPSYRFSVSYQRLFTKVAPLLPTEHQAHAVYLVLRAHAATETNKEFHNGLEEYLARFTKATCKKALSMSENFEKNSLLLLYARHQITNFFGIYRIHQKFFTLEELKELLEYRNLNHVSVLDEILCADYSIFNLVTECYEGDVDRLRSFLEAGYDGGTSSLQRLTAEKYRTVVSSARLNLSHLYTDDNKLWDMLMREDAQGQTCLHHAAKNGTLDIWLTFAYEYSSTPNVNSSVLGCLAGCRSEEFATTKINEKKITEIYERALHENPNQVLPILKRAVENKSLLVSNANLLENFFTLIIVFKCAGKFDADQNETLGLIIKAIRETHNQSSKKLNPRSHSFDPILLDILEQLITPGTKAFKEEGRHKFPAENLIISWLQQVNVSVTSINLIFHTQINRLHEPSLSTFLYLKKVLSLITKNANNPEHIQFDPVTQLIILRRFVRVLPFSAYISSNFRAHPDWERLVSLLYLSPHNAALHVFETHERSAHLNTLIMNQSKIRSNKYLKISNDSTALPRHTMIKWINAEIEKYFTIVLEPLAKNASNEKILSVLNTPVFDSKGEKLLLINFLIHSNCQAGANLIDLHRRLVTIFEPDINKKILNTAWVEALLTYTGSYLSNETLHQKLVELIDFYSLHARQEILLFAVKYTKIKISILDHALMNDALWNRVVELYAGQIARLQKDLEEPEYRNGKTSTKIESCLDAPDRLQRIFNLYKDDLARLRDFSVRHFFNKTNLSIIGKNHEVIVMLIKLFEGCRIPGLFTHDENKNTLLLTVKADENHSVQNENCFSLAYLFISIGDTKEALTNLVKLQDLLSDTVSQSELRDNVIAHALKNENKDLLDALGYVLPEKLLPKTITHSPVTTNSNTADEYPSHRSEIKAQNKHETPPIIADPDQPMSSAMSLAIDAAAKQENKNNTPAADNLSPSDKNVRVVVNPANNTLIHTIQPAVTLNTAAKESGYFQFPIKRLVEILNALPNDDKRETMLLDVNRNGMNQVQFRVLNGESPLPLLRTLLSYDRRWKFFWQTLPNQDLTLIQAILSMPPCDAYLKCYFENLFKDCTAETPLESLYIRFEQNNEDGKNAFRLALEKNAFATLELLAYLYNTAPTRLVSVLDELDETGLNLLHHSSSSAAQLTTVVSLYPAGTDIAEKFSISSKSVGTALHIAFHNNILDTAIYLIQPDQRYQRLTDISPLKYNQNIFRLYLSKYFIENTIENNFSSLRSENTTPSNIRINTSEIKLLTILASLPPGDFASAMQLPFQIQDGISNEFTLLEHLCTLKYNRWSNIVLSNENRFNLTKHLVQAWHCILFRADQNGNLLTHQKIAMLKQLFPEHVAKNVKYPEIESEKYPLMKVLLSLLVVCNSSITPQLKDEVKSFLFVVKNFVSKLTNDILGARYNLKVLMKLIQKLIKSKVDVKHDEIVNCPANVTREWFLAIKHEAQEIPHVFSSQRGRLPRAMTDHFDWFTKEFPNEPIDYSIWILCLRRALSMISTFIIKAHEIYFTESKQLIELIELNPTAAKERFLMPLVRRINEILEKKYHQPAFLHCNSSERDIAHVFEPVGLVKTSDLVTTDLLTAEQLSPSPSELNLREVVLSLLPLEHQPSALYFFISDRAVNENNRDFYDRLETFLYRFTNECRTKALLMRSDSEKNSLLLLFARHQPMMFSQVLKVFQKFIEKQEIQTLLECRNDNFLSAWDELLISVNFTTVTKFYNSDLERLRNVLEDQYDKGKSCLQKLTLIKNELALSLAINNLKTIYGSQALWSTLMRNDSNGKTCLHHAAENGTLILWFVWGSNELSLMGVPTDFAQAKAYFSTASTKNNDTASAADINFAPLEIANATIADNSNTVPLRIILQWNSTDIETGLGEVLNLLSRDKNLACSALVYCFIVLTSDKEISMYGASLISDIILNIVIPLIEDTTLNIETPNNNKNSNFRKDDIELLIETIKHLLIFDTNHEFIDIFREERANLPDDLICWRWLAKISSFSEKLFDQLDDHKRRGNDYPMSDNFQLLRLVYRHLDSIEAPVEYKLLALRRAASVFKYRMTGLYLSQRHLIDLILLPTEVAKRCEWHKDLTEHPLKIQHSVDTVWDFFGERKRGDSANKNDDDYQRRQPKGKGKKSATSSSWPKIANMETSDLDLDAGSDPEEVETAEFKWWHTTL